MAELSEIEEIGQKINEWFHNPYVLNALERQTLFKESEKYLSHDVGNPENNDFFHEELEHFKRYLRETSQQNVVGGSNRRNVKGKTEKITENLLGRNKSHSKHSQRNKVVHNFVREIPKDIKTVYNFVRKDKGISTLKSKLKKFAHWQYNQYAPIHLPALLLEYVILDSSMPGAAGITLMFAAYMYYYGLTRNIEEIENLKQTIENQLKFPILDTGEFLMARHSGDFQEPDVILERIEGLRKRGIITERQKSEFSNKIQRKRYYTQMAYDLDAKIPEAKQSGEKRKSLENEIRKSRSEGLIAEWDKKLLLIAVRGTNK